jgi:hypothetical protein
MSRIWSLTLPNPLQSRRAAFQTAAVAFAALLVFLAAARAMAAPPPTGEFPPSEPYFSRTWERTDKPVADQQIDRTWMWGPHGFTEAMRESYAEGHDHSREVQYFDKSRMEITTDPSVDPNSIWFVTNGLLVNELTTGRLQVGDNEFESHNPALGNVAGDPEGSSGPTYAALGLLRDVGPHPAGEIITATVDHFGNVNDQPALSSHGVTAAHYVEDTRHAVASVFWDFMHSAGLVYENGQFVNGQLFDNPFYATGFPVTEAYWTTVPVGNEPTLVLVQAFERRVLTYTPDNPEGWKVEAGNVGRHYFEWRYVQIPNEDEPTATPTGTTTATTTVTATSTGVGTYGDMDIEGVVDGEVRILNMTQVTDNDVNMLGWTLYDDTTYTYTFPEVWVKPGFYINVRPCTGQNIIEKRYAIVYTGVCQPIYDGGTLYLKNPFGDISSQFPKAS